jgi:predicted DNA-binding transcriptional regulator AlpA
MEKAGLFPMHLTLGEGQKPAVAWLEAEVTAWIEARLAARAEPATDRTAASEATPL